MTLTWTIILSWLLQFSFFLKNSYNTNIPCSKCLYYGFCFFFFVTKNVFYLCYHLTSNSQNQEGTKSLIYISADLVCGLWQRNSIAAWCSESVGKWNKKLESIFFSAFTSEFIFRLYFSRGMNNTSLIHNM